MNIGVLDSQTCNLCIFCNEEVETIDHVLLRCNRVWLVWTSIIRQWGSLWVVPRSINDHLDWWWGFKFKRYDRKLWDALPATVFWVIWKMRNECIFNGAQPKWEQCAELVKIRVAVWLKSKCNRIQYSVHDFVHNLDSIRHCQKNGTVNSSLEYLSEKEWNRTMRTNLTRGIRVAD